ncbi:serine hydrolase domain-containing protein [Microbacteriaceae bacterium 4G12]
MNLSKNITNQFDPVIDYAKEINMLNGGSATAVVVIHKDEIVTEHYSGYHSHEIGARLIGSDSQFHVASARKSYIGFAVALAVYEKKIKSIDDFVLHYLPELDSQLLQGTTIRHLLTHTHGLHEDENGNIYREFLPGTNWAYRGVNISTLAQIVKRTTGKSVAELLQENVFAPLQFVQTGWRTKENERLVRAITGPKGQTELTITPSDEGDDRNLFVSAREFAYWGYLHLKKGKVDGKQVVPKEIFDWTTTIQSPNLLNKNLPQNGFLWHVKGLPAKQSEIGEKVPRGSYQILGVTGPLVLVIPTYDLVVVRMYNKRNGYGGTDGTKWLHYIREFGDRVVDCMDMKTTTRHLNANMF